MLDQMVAPTVRANALSDVRGGHQRLLLRVGAISGLALKADILDNRRNLRCSRYSLLSGSRLLPFFDAPNLALLGSQKKEPPWPASIAFVCALGHLAARAAKSRGAGNRERHICSAEGGSHAARRYTRFITHTLAATTDAVNFSVHLGLLLDPLRRRLSAGPR